MKTNSYPTLLLTTLATVLTAAMPMASHADPVFWGYRPVVYVPVAAPVCEPAPTPAAPVTNSAPGAYLPHLAQAYRMGYCAGRNDRACGFNRDYRRAFEVSGSGWESYFQEGYADGYDCRPMNH